MRLCTPGESSISGAESSSTRVSLRMLWEEDCRTAGFGKTERPVGWEGDGELSRVKLVRHCERGKPAGTDRLHLQALSHPFTLDLVAVHDDLNIIREVQELIEAQ